MVKSGQAWSGLIVTRDATGLLATPSVGPAGVLYVDGTANGASVTVTGSNPYKWAVTLPTLTAGQSVSMYITATVGGIATGAVVAEDIADTKRVSDLNDAAEAPSAPTVASAVRVELATELDRLDADVSSRLAEEDYTPPPSVVDVAAAIMGSAYNGYVEGSFGNVSEWVPTSQSNATAVRTELAVELARLDEDVSAGAHPGDAMTLADDAITAAKYDQSTAHPLAQADAGSTAVARTGADGDTLETLSDEIAGIEAGSGSGTGTYTDTVTDGVDPLDNVLVQLSTDAAGANMVYSTHTAANGAFTLRPDPGTYYVWFELAGYSFTQGAQVVVT